MTSRLLIIVLAVLFAILGLVLALLDVNRGWAFLILIPFIAVLVLLVVRRKGAHHS